MNSLEMEIVLDPKGVDQALKITAGLAPQLQRKVLRDATFSTGRRLRKQVKVAAKVGRTGTLKRTIASKNLRFANKGLYISLIGNRRDKRATIKQAAKLIRRNGFLSLGISGRGKSVPLHFIENRTRAKLIRAIPGSTPHGRLFWNIVRPDTRVPIRTSPSPVRHPGSRPNPFVEKTYRRNFSSNNAHFLRFVNRGVLRYIKYGRVA